MNHLSHPDVNMRQFVLKEEWAVTIILIIFVEDFVVIIFPYYFPSWT